MVLKLYAFSPSPPNRGALMVAKAIGLEYEFHEINTLKGEQKNPEFVKINPQHTVPTLQEDDGFVVWDSHAIITYIVSKYAADESLYPKDDIKLRATIHQRLFFDSGTLFPRFGATITQLVKGSKTIDEEAKAKLEEAYGFMEAFLENGKWAAGDSITIADYSLVASISSLNLFLPVDPKKYPKVADWLKRAETLPGYEVNKEGLEVLKGFLQSFNQ